jgi:hypothetical protein
MLEKRGRGILDRNILWNAQWQVSQMTTQKKAAAYS